MTSRLAGRAALPRRNLAAGIATAVAAGTALGWAVGGTALGWGTAGPSVALAGLAILVAAANGYAKAYSP